MNALWLAVRLPGNSPTPELERLACWAGRFTPRVSIAANGLLLEIGGCLRLFVGLDALRQDVAEGLAEHGLIGPNEARIAVSPTPQAALWLAEGDGENLDALLVADLTWPPGVAEKLMRFGLRRLGELRRLLSAALARRIGREATTMIARAYGEAPDPRPDFVFPPRFDQAIELPAPVENSAALLFAARRLTAALSGWLAVRQAGLRECRLHLLHRQGETALPLRFADATRDGGRIERVLRERLERLQLAAPVEGLRLVAEAVEPLAGRSGGLFDEGGAKEGMAALIERLRARLGEEKVFGVASVADHRPECATRRAPAGNGGRDGGNAAQGPRPFWLLAMPEPLAEIGGRPHRRGPLRLLTGPERIESGWWQQGETEGESEAMGEPVGEKMVGDIRRDYFVALTADDRWAWIFRELRPPGGWFLHGWFA